MAPPSLPGFAANRLRAGPKPTVAHKPRPAAAARAGLMPWVPVGLSAGIGIWFALPFQPGPVFFALLAVVAICALIVTGRAIRWAETGRISWRAADLLRLSGWAILLVAAGLSVTGIRAMRADAPVLGWRYYGPVEGRVVQIDRSGRDRMRITLDQVVLRDLSPARTPEKVRLSLMNRAADDLPRPGQRVMLTGHLSPPPGPASPGSFDFRSFAWFDGLGAVGYSRNPILNVAPPQGGFWAMHQAQRAIAQAISDRIGGQAGAVAAALMTGDRSGITEATNELMRASNLYHIISISGLHMGMLAGFIYGALRLALVAAQGAGLRLRWPAHKIAAVVAMAGAAIYLWLSGGGVATERAFIMVAVMLMAILADRRAISLRSVALAATIILVLNPEALGSPGFQMSFAATVALILVYGPWARLSPAIPWWLRPVVMLVVSSFVAGMATSPIAAAHFSRMAQYGLLANLLAVPVMGTLVMPAGVIAALLAPLGLEAPALWVMGLGTQWMLIVAQFVADLDGAVSAIPMPPTAVMPLLGIGATVAVLGWRRGQMRPALSVTVLTSGGGGLLVLAGFLTWGLAARPLLLIAPEGEAVGLMTPAGRVVSKPSGGSFVVENWLLEDGDAATQAESAGRAGWNGPRRERQARIEGTEWRVVHLTGKGAAAAALPHCTAQVILIVDDRVETDNKAPPCLLFDQRRLKQTGAVAITFPDGDPQLRSVADITGARPWAGR
ncbi:ComEC family competence protein [Paracoccus sp. M683]|uniref:ComEC/Rec2 family competence protein n=1 Tax=Paracoccus sp. M683 TaxID=2594268 RepID=UPI00118068A2|nr:ComEC/Rec2 family competence protein [Paracoccus sp. M683]TRW97373.1 ComEC family competence protein [Paracoccus sp. M683]